MAEQLRFPGIILMVAGLAFAGLIGFAGCAKQEPAATTTVETPAAKPADAQTVAAEQTTCPVMGGAINKALFVEYKGQKVYFCCAGCPETFKADPQKYIAKLPQFKK